MTEFVGRLETFHKCFKNQRICKLVLQTLKRYPEAATGSVLEKGVLKNFAKPTGKHLSQSRFFNDVTGLGPF